MYMFPNINIGKHFKRFKVPDPDRVVAGASRKHAVILADCDIHNHTNLRRSEMVIERLVWSECMNQPARFCTPNLDYIVVATCNEPLAGSVKDDTVDWTEMAVNGDKFLVSTSDYAGSYFGASYLAWTGQEVFVKN
jgi:hypothetical protein